MDTGQTVAIDGPAHRVGVVEVLRSGRSGFVVRIAFESVVPQSLDEGQLEQLAARCLRRWPTADRFVVQCPALSGIVDVVMRTIRDGEGLAEHVDLRPRLGTDHLLMTA